VISWYRKFPDKLFNDVETVTHEFKELKLTHQNEEIEWYGPINYRGIEYKIKIKCPAAYPFTQPKFFVYTKKNEEFRIETFNNNEHLNSDGSICLFPEDGGSDSWNYNMGITDAIYKFYKFVDEFYKGTISSRHYSRILDNDNLQHKMSMIFMDLDFNTSINDYGEVLVTHFYNNLIQNSFFLTEKITIESRRNIGKRKTADYNKTFDISSWNVLLKYISFETRKITIPCFTIDPFIFEQIKLFTSIDDVITALPKNIQTNKIKSQRFVIFLTYQKKLKQDLQVLSIYHEPSNNRKKNINIYVGSFANLYHERTIRRINVNFDDYIICLVGVGSLGSHVALNLVKYGFLNYILIDQDILTFENLTRHILDFRFVNLFKVEGVKLLIQSHNPNSSVEIIPDSITLNNNITKILKRQEDEGKKLIIVSCSADDEADNYINLISLQLELPVVFAYCNQDATAGRIFKLVPGKTPCFECYKLYVSSGDIDQLNTLNGNARRPRYLQNQPGLQLDISEIAIQTTRQVISLIEDLDTNSIISNIHLTVNANSKDTIEYKQYKNLSINNYCKLCNYTYTNTRNKDIDDLFSNINKKQGMS
jgi:molybdopterin/thiamine biosynthesis adenylyltransferase/ubiquitin-protein ligase